jgi:hypothetical protein
VLKIVRDQGGVELDHLRALVAIRNSAAQQLTGKYGQDVPEQRPIADLEAAFNRMLAV